MHNPTKVERKGIVPGFEDIQQWVSSALEEDIRGGDITTDSIVEADRTAKALVTAKEEVTLCGLDIFKAVFQKLDTDCVFDDFGHKDRAQVKTASEIIQVTGNARAILTGERAALNILQRLSGIATQTRQYAEAARPVTILDTRKTTPGMRIFEKYAVSCGGAENHRIGLFDAVLIKDNHIKVAGSIAEAVRRVRDKLGQDFPVEVEVTNSSEIEQALSARANTLLLDNMDDDAIKSAVKMIDGNARIEVSGNITLDRLKTLSTFCIDYISVGALTHSVRAVDLSLNIDLS